MTLLSNVTKEYEYKHGYVYMPYCEQHVNEKRGPRVFPLRLRTVNSKHTCICRNTYESSSKEFDFLR